VAKYDTVVGPIGTAISVLVFLYFSSVILLLGAELVRAGALEAEAAARAAQQAVSSDSGPPGAAAQPRG
jgi:uncharacterized BrkB/YihY/UPF0761 family membrane protein